MAVATFEGVVEAGKIRLLKNEILPERAKVYVLIPDFQEEEPRITYPVSIPANPRVLSPRLAKREDDHRLAVNMSEDNDAGV